MLVLCLQDLLGIVALIAAHGQTEAGAKLTLGRGRRVGAMGGRESCKAWR